jgi:CCR4-NOT complex subunit CAF16
VPHHATAGMQGDISAETMISGVEGVDPARRQMLIEMLDIDLSWWAAHRLADAMRVGLQSVECAAAARCRM